MKPYNLVESPVHFLHYASGFSIFKCHLPFASHLCGLLAYTIPDIFLLCLFMHCTRVSVCVVPALCKFFYRHFDVQRFIVVRQAGGGGLSRMPLPFAIVCLWALAHNHSPMSTLACFCFFGSLSKLLAFFKWF